MKSSQKGPYALQALMMLARHHNQRAIKIRDIFDAEVLPERFLELILFELKNARMVDSVRGAKTGYRLRRDPPAFTSRRSSSSSTVPWPRSATSTRCVTSSTETSLTARSISSFSMPATRPHASTTPLLATSSQAPTRKSARRQANEEPEENRQRPPYGGRRRRVTNKRVIKRIFGFVCLLVSAISGWAQGTPNTIRIGAFPNITHAQAMVGKANGWFDRALGPQVKVHWTSFNAGPSAIEALFAGAIDITYVGPNPAINGYVRSNGEALRVVAGAASGGASLIVRNDSGIRKPEDFHGKRVAIPQFGNTQDVALRNWLKNHALKTNDKGGDVQIVPMANPDQLTLFLRKDLDAAWAPEPWATRLIHDGNGRLFVDERSLWPDGQFVIGLLVVNTRFLKAHPDLVKNWIRANVDLTDWINAHQSEAKKLLNEQIQRETGKALPSIVLDEAFSRMQVTYDPLHAALNTAAEQAFADGFLGRTMPDLSGLYDLALLNQVLAEKNRKAIQ